MHRGSSKGRSGSAPDPENLPLSASPAIRIELEIARAGSSEIRTVVVPKGTPLRAVLRRIGQSAEGSAVLSEGRSVPLDLVLERGGRFTVIPTFSGG